VGKSPSGDLLSCGVFFVPGGQILACMTMKMYRTVLTWRMGYAFLRGCQTLQSENRKDCAGCSWCPFGFHSPVTGKSFKPFCEVKSSAAMVSRAGKDGFSKI